MPTSHAFHKGLLGRIINGVRATLRTRPDGSPAEEMPEQGDIWHIGGAVIYVTEVDRERRVTLVNDNGFETWCTTDEFVTYQSRTRGRHAPARTAFI